MAKNFDSCARKNALISIDFRFDYGEDDDESVETGFCGCHIFKVAIVLSNLVLLLRAGAIAYLLGLVCSCNPEPVSYPSSSMNISLLSSNKNAFSSVTFENIIKVTSLSGTSHLMDRKGSLVISHNQLESSFSYGFVSDPMAEVRKQIYYWEDSTRLIAVVCNSVLGLTCILLEIGIAWNMALLVVPFLVFGVADYIVIGVGEMVYTFVPNMQMTIEGSAHLPFDHINILLDYQHLIVDFHIFLFSMTLKTLALYVALESYSAMRKTRQKKDSTFQYNPLRWLAEPDDKALI